MWGVPILKQPFLTVETIMKPECKGIASNFLDDSQVGTPRRGVQVGTAPPLPKSEMRPVLKNGQKIV
jgi:hypothetical protein